MSCRCSRQRSSMICSSRKRSSARISSSPSSASRASYWRIASSVDQLDQLLLVERARARSSSIGDADRVDRRERAEQRLEVPVLDVVVGGVLLDRALEHGGDLLARLREVRALEHLVAQLVDHAALLVHHVVVLERVLAGEVVLLLDLALRLLDLLGEQAGLDRLLVALDVDAAEAVEDPVDAVAREQADQVVLGGEEEAALAGVALASGAPAQLVVDAARLVALGADDVEAAGVEHALAVLPRARASSVGSSSAKCSS